MTTIIYWVDLMFKSFDQGRVCWKLAGDLGSKSNNSYLPDNLCLVLGYLRVFLLCFKNVSIVLLGELLLIDANGIF